ncbi:MAG: carbamoyltransferase HypF [Chloroflexota bacterium]
MSERRRLLIQGAVQGVGFRPFIFRLAMEIGVWGWVSNSAQGVIIEAEAPACQLETFLAQIEIQKPPHSFIQQMSMETIPAVGETTFTIHQSSAEGSRTTIMLPDLATCLDCLNEIFDPTNRRFRYPFTNCTNCGPRYSIIERLPYDRPNTTMSAFVMCDDCRAEYENPLDRRFHAQPNACPHCGPHLSFWDSTGKTLADCDEALLMAADALRKGAIVALKGMGGFQLLVDARNAAAVRLLRERKQRPDKPFALMVRTLAEVEALCDLVEMERSLLDSSESPILLLRQKPSHSLCAGIAPGNPNLGVMLPYTPLHHLLMAELDFPIVATSGNRSGEPICTEEREALTRLSGLADYFLVHNRPIRRPVDDSVMRVMAETPIMLRRARGYAPLPVELPEDIPATIATGAHLKNTVAVSIGRQVFISQHIGDLEAPESVATFRGVLSDLQSLYEQPPALIACDLHPDYRSTHLAHELGARYEKPVIAVQHHYAHVLAGMAEHHLKAPVLGIAWDGTGYGSDGTIWGGEFLYVTGRSFERRAYLRPFRLPGGEQAIREPRRAALGLLFELYGETLTDVPDVSALGFSAAELRILKRALTRGINAPLTSSMGRFFDGVAALIGLRQRATFEGQAAMDLEFACESTSNERSNTRYDDRWYPFSVTPVTNDEGHIGSIIEWRSVIEGILDDLINGLTTREVATTFHNSLVEMMVKVALTVAAENQVEQVVLSGGCFQNKRLLEKGICRLREAGLQPYWSQKIPINDGGIALGQIVAAGRENHPLEKGEA